MTNTSPVAVIHGAGCSIGAEIAANLATQDVRLLVYDGLENGPTGVVDEAVRVHGRIDFLLNCVVPGPNTSAEEVFRYPQQLLARNLAAAEAMVACDAKGAIVNQWFLGSLFEGTSLEAPVLMSKGAITGLTRQICCKFGKSGLRINTIQLGLVDLPETKGLATEKTLARKPPVGRWASATEVAKFMIFLALKNGYMTGQTICFDGGLTAGNTGT